MEAISISGSTFHCKLCNVACVSESEMKIHLLTLRHKNGGIRQAFRCKICSKLLGSKSAASTHLRNIHKKKLKSCYKCANCSLEFKNKSRLIIHSVVHITWRDYHCPFCGEICSQFQSLMAHIRSHINEKPFSCKICDKSYNLWYKLNNHHCSATGSARSSTSLRLSVSPPRIESEVRNLNASNTDHQSNAQRTERQSFSCDVCDKSFRLRIMLADHRRTHSVQASETVATSANSEPVVCPVNRTMSPNQTSDRGNTAQQTTTTISFAATIQTRIAAEEKAIEAKLREAAQLEGQIRGQQIIVEKVSEHTGTKLMTCGAGQTNQVDAFSDEYLVLRIDAEKGSIATKKKNLETLRQQVQSLQMKVEAWRLCLEL